MHNLKQLAPYLIFLTVLIGGQGIFCCLDSFAQAEKPKPFFGIVIDSEEASPFHINALIGEIDKGMNPSLVVGEELILITTYKFEGKVQQTRLLNINENPMSIYDLKVGQRVEVFGFQLPDKTIVGHQVQVKKPMKSDPDL